MASSVTIFGISSFPALNLSTSVYSRYQIRCSATQNSTAAASTSKESGGFNGFSYIVKESKNGSVDLSSKVKDFEEEKLEALWDDGYGSETVKDYLDLAKDIIKPDGGPPRWFTPILCGPHLRNSPVLLFLPGIGGLGLGLILHHKSLGKVFDVWCMHIPVEDRTPFQGLVEWVEKRVRIEHCASPKKPIYLVGDSFGGCLALAVAARNPELDLVVILANPATSFGRSQLWPIFPLLEALPNNFHKSVSYLSSFVMGDPLKMATVDVNAVLPPQKYFEQLASNLTTLLPRVSGLAYIMPKETMLWKMKLLKTAAAYANSRLHAVKAEVLVLASGNDNLLPSRDEALRLLQSIETCKVRYFKDNGHNLLLEDGVNLLTIIKATATYRRSRNHDFVTDFLPPSLSEFNQHESNLWLYHNLASPVIMSTNEDGKILRGLSGVPNEGPVLLVGYHMLVGFELAPILEQFLREKKTMVRTLGHNIFFTHLAESGNHEFSLSDYMKLYGVLPVSSANMYKLFAANSHVLLYPGGSREALHRKGEQYKLFWPDQPEFVRMAAKFGATIVPFGVVGEDDLAELVLDYDDLMKVPIVNDYIKTNNEENPSIRSGMSGEVSNQDMYYPGLIPKVPGRLYCLFGKPIQTKGRKDLLNDREKAREFYMQIKSEVENNISYLLKKREEDPYRGVIDRTIYRAFRAPLDQVPSYEL